MMRTLTLLTAAAGALSAGALLPFSTFTMRALGDRPALEAVRTMQAVNDYAPRGLFIAAFAASALAGAGLAVHGLVRPASPGALARVVGGAALTGAFVVTVAINVPLNNRLADTRPTDEASARVAWESYRAPWTTANSVRVAIGAFGAVTLLLAGTGAPARG